MESQRHIVKVHMCNRPVTFFFLKEEEEEGKKFLFSKLTLSAGTQSNERNATNESTLHQEAKHTH